MSGTRLNKYIASSGLCSRRKADEYILNGAVSVNGKIVNELGFLVQSKDKVCVNNKLIQPQKFKYYRFYKPAGYITTRDDDRNRKIIYDLLPEELFSLKPVGRLDKDSTGLLILTNDGDLINALTHPSIKVPKIYIVTVDAKLQRSELEKLANGVEIEPGKIAYADIQVLEMDSKHTEMQITLYQGMNRQIRKMFKSIGYEVKTLKRIQHATITLDGLKRAEFKQIKPSQIRELKNFLNRISKS